MKTNRDYFSWSQYQTWHKSKKEFYKKYGIGEKSLSNKYFDKGKEFGHYMETGEIPHTVQNPEMLELIGSKVDVLEIMERELRVNIADYELLSYLDTSMEDCTEFFEYKTGKEPWTQERVDEWEQLNFYAMCCYIANGEKVIPNCKLYWIETDELDDGTIVYTGHVEEFERKFDIVDMTDMLAKILVTLQDIDEWEYEELELPEEKIARYIEIEKIIEELSTEKDLIRLEVMQTMEEQNVKYASSSKGSFSISERANYAYSKSLTEKQKKYKDEITELQKQEKKDGKAKKIVSQSLRFNIKKQK